MQLGALVACWGAPLGGRGQLDPSTPVGPICTDSRSLAHGQLFIPLVGERFDGHRFLPQAAAAGAQAAVVQRDRSADVPSGLLHWLVDDTLAAYQHLASLHRQSMSAPVVAVTGSAGKTTTRELIRVALESLGPVVASSGNENNDVGVPQTVFKADALTRALVVEMGMRGLGEIERLSQCCQPDVAVITNIGTAHLGRLGSREAIATAKSEITASLQPNGLLVIPSGDPLLDVAIQRCWSGRVARVALSDEPGSDQASLVGALDEQADCLTVSGEVIHLPLAGRHNARNFLLAIAVAQELGVPLQRLKQLQVEVPGGRNRRVQLGRLTLLDETYNASPEAVTAALALLARHPGRRFAVLGTMLELGEHSVTLHRQVAAYAASLGLDGLVIVSDGAEAEAMADAARALPRLAVVGAPEQAAIPLLEWLAAGDVLLLKASRGVALERLIPLLHHY